MSLYLNSLMVLSENVIFQILTRNLNQFFSHVNYFGRGISNITLYKYEKL